MAGAGTPQNQHNMSPIGQSAGDMSMSQALDSLQANAKNVRRIEKVLATNTANAALLVSEANKDPALR